ncbi:MAG TPA: alpha/beta hydrolase, partial [Methylomirabilota bacterium]|nr:alpha/beta hydrolase [Methylomirabilota bacterium]
LLLEPDLFDTYMAFDPSLWWNRGKLAADAGGLVKALAGKSKTLYLATSREGDVGETTTRLVKTLATAAPPSLRRHFTPMPGETHRTIYHPAALAAFRTVLAPAEGSGK